MTFWIWFGLAALLAVAEMLAPGFVLIWFALGAAAAGLLLWLMPAADWTLQFLIFLAAALASLGIWRWFGPTPAAADPTLNLKLSSLVGQTGSVEQPIVNGNGRIRLGDSSWAVVGPDLPKDAPVRVIGAKDGRLVVEATHRDAVG